MQRMEAAMLVYRRHRRERVAEESNLKQTALP
jgi:hypothetical protein